MNIHKNAKTTPKMRALLAARRQAGEPPRAIASAGGVSPATVATRLLLNGRGASGTKAWRVSKTGP
ncbi:MAG: hypothetical protein M3178_04150, partial [Pseudomonadota bacterium]|nr:hypothetical protein [Pseudomonadota bacterium]